MIDLRACLHELFVFREMQTDPNWSNFLWNPKTRLVTVEALFCLRLYLPFPFSCSSRSGSGRTTVVDFGATRNFSSEFIDNRPRLLLAAAQRDRELKGCLRWSLKLNYLTGEENDVSPLSPPSRSAKGFD